MSKQEIPTTYDPSIEPGMAELTTDLAGQPFIIRGDEELLREHAARLIAEAPKQKQAVVKPVEAPVTAPKAEMVQVTDLSLLEPREVLRRKIQAKLWDMTHGSNMYGLFTEKLNDDRNVAFATKLGLLTVGDTYCQKHAKAVSKLRGMELTH